MHPGTTAALALHWQNDIVTPDGAFGPFFAAMAADTGVVARTASLLGSCREAGVPVYYARICFADDYSDLIINNFLFAQVAETDSLKASSHGAAVIDELTPKSGDIVVDHVRTSPFYGTNLLEQLTAAGVETVLITGVATNVVVEAAARDAMNAGLETVVVSDCCSAADLAAHEASLGTLQILASSVVQASDALEQLHAGVS